MEDPNLWHGYEYKQSVLLYEGRLVIPNKFELIPTLLEEILPHMEDTLVFTKPTEGLLQMYTG